MASQAVAPAGVIENIPAPTAPVLHAAHALSDYTGFATGVATEGQRAIRLSLNGRPDPDIGNQGYTIRSGRGARTIEVAANDAEGLANGVYTLLRTLKIEHRADPFSRAWDVKEKPQFAIRAMLVSPYRFGGSYGFAELSSDRWSFEDWKEYVDLLRLTNMTTLTMGSERVYHPDYPNSWREKWRYDVWKQVMDYCHQVGIRFNWFMSPNLVTEQAFWDNPDLRANQAELFWYGNGLSWKRGKDVILENQRYTFEHFRGLDALEIIFSDGGAFSLDDDTAEPAVYIADSIRAYRKLLRDTGNDAGFVYWNWILDIWTRVHMSDEALRQYPKYVTLQEDIVPLLPRDVTWLDASMLTLIQTHWHMIQARGNPALREGLMVGRDAGFRPIIDFFWYMNPEFSINMFPHPYFGRTLQEAQYARDEIGADGVMGYRLAPPLQFIADYTFFRVASDPSLTQARLIAELAGMLTEQPASRAPFTEALASLERFWLTHELAQLEKAETLLRGLLADESSRPLQYLSNGLTFLTYVVRMAQPGVTAEETDRLMAELYDAVKTMYIFQGITADIVWLPEALRAFRARVKMMVEEYAFPVYQNTPYSEIVDRAIYPEATAEPFVLRWPEPTGSRDDANSEKGPAESH